MNRDTLTNFLYGYVRWVQHQTPELTSSTLEHMRNEIDAYIEHECVYPNYTCGECSAWMACTSGDTTLKDIICKCCNTCNVYIEGCRKI